MSRVPMLEPSEFAPELQQRLGAEALANRVGLGSMRVWARRPEVARAFADFTSALAATTTLTLRLRELVRLRVAFHNQCRSCMATRSRSAIDDGMTDDLVCQLAHPDEATDLTDAERAALHYADLLATDHLAITDTTFDRLRAYFTDDEIVELGIHIGVCVGFGRVAMSWDLVDDLPDVFRGSDVVGPWLPGTVER